MKKIPFIKMAGAGNDFIVIDKPSGAINLKNLTLKVCDRTDGIGADGLLILEPSKKSDYKMRIINADGSEAEMCGNGARCMAAYIARTRKPRAKTFTMETLAGEIAAEVIKEELAKVRLSVPKDYQSDIPITVNGRKMHVHYIDTGVPHTVIFVDNLEQIDVSSIGNTIRFHERFKPRGTNVNFVEQMKDGLVAARTYERGVEDETKACGTGSVASAIIAFLKANPKVTRRKNATMNVLTRGKETLEVSFDLEDNHIRNVWLKGSAKFIAQGDYFYSNTR